MQVNSVSNLSVNQKASFGNKDFQRAILEEFANTDDRTLRRTALEITEQQVDSKKHKRINDGIWAAVPVVAGLAAAVAVPGGRIPMLKQFVSTAALWMGAFAGIDLVNAGARALNNNSDSVRDFNKKNPTLSFLLNFGAAIGGMLAGGALVSKGISKFGPKLVAQAKKLKVDKFIKESKVINKASELVAKVPSALKAFGKKVLNWSPMMLMLTALVHTSNHERAKATQTVNNYTQLKEAQAQAKTALAMTEALDGE